MSISISIPISIPIVVIDNDECIGSWNDISLIYMKYKYYNKCEPPLDVMTTIMEVTGVLRPYLNEFYTRLLELKDRGKIHSIYMCTLASNINGWVTYLCRLIENWYGNKIYDKVIDGEMIKDWNKNRNGYVSLYKDMDYIRELHNNNTDISISSSSLHIVMIDDNPQNIINSDTIYGIPQYHVAIDLNRVCKIYFKDTIPYPFINNNSRWLRYLRFPHEFTKASEDLHLIKALKTIENAIL